MYFESLIPREALGSLGSVGLSAFRFSTPASVVEHRFLHLFLLFRRRVASSRQAAEQLRLLQEYSARRNRDAVAEKVNCCSLRTTELHTMSKHNVNVPVWLCWVNHSIAGMHTVL